MVAHALADDPAAVEWVTGHLRGLVGEGDELAGRAENGAVATANRDGRRDEAFTAWRRFLYGLANRRPLVLVLEDLHWADDALLDFVEELLEPTGLRTPDRHGRPLHPRTPPAAPLLVVATAREELLARRPDLARGDGAALAIELEPLSEADTGHLLETLLASHRLPTGVGPALLAAAGGNPLFAEEYVRMVRDHPPMPDPVGPVELPLPETVHAIIAARLDALPAEEKAALQDLSVLGRVGWVGALAAVSGRTRAEVEACLERLAAKEFLYRAGRASMAGEREYGFRHVLVCEVAYGQIPRLERADKHRRAAAWLESLSAERSELLAHHYGRALELASAAGQATGDLAERARLALRDAGDRVSGLGAHVTAARYYTRALAIWPPDDPERPDLELRAGEAHCLGEGTGEDLLVRARDGLLARGDRGRAAEAEARLGQLAYAKGQERSSHLDRALALVADAPPSRSKAVVLSHGMMHLLVADRNAEALQVGPRGPGHGQEPRRPRRRGGRPRHHRGGQGQPRRPRRHRRPGALHRPAARPTGPPASSPGRTTSPSASPSWATCGAASRPARPPGRRPSASARPCACAGWSWSGPASTTGAAAGTRPSGWPTRWRPTARTAPRTTWRASAGSGGAASGWPGASSARPWTTPGGRWPWPGTPATA